MEEQTAGGAEPQKNTLVALAVKDLARVEKGLAKLKETYGNVVYDVTIPKGMDQAKKACATIREVRFKVEHIRKAEASRIAAAQKTLNAEAARITEAIKLIETPIDAQITAEEERKEREKQEAAAKEQARVDGIRARLDALRALGDVPSNSNPAALRGQAAALQNTVVTTAQFEEFLDEATHIRDTGAAALLREAQRLELVAEEAAKARAQAEALALANAEIERLKAQLAAATSAAAPAPQPAQEAAVEPAPAPEEDPEWVPGQGVIESLHQGQPINPATESWAAQEQSTSEVGVAAGMPIELLEAADQLVDDTTPSTDRIVAAVASFFGVDEATAKRYIVKAGEELAFETI